MSLPADLMPADLLPLLLRLVCVLYLSVTLAHVLLQGRYAARHARQHASSKAANRTAAPQPVVDVIVPCYNENPSLLDACLTSIARQDYQGRLRVFVVDDGSHNRTELLPVQLRHGKRPGWRLTLLPHRVSKRRAIDAALRLGDGEVVITVDSDTVLLPGAVSQIVLPFADDDQIGAVSGNLRALNADRNLLTRLINRNYWMLFEQERAAQSLHRAVLCSWGGFAAYRRPALQAVWDRHLNQAVAGKPCTTGDDLHLTLLLLARGDDVLAHPDARALTQAPSTLRHYARQQLRWNRSFLRELPWAVRAVTGRPIFLTFDLAVRAVTPFLLTAVVLLYLLEVLTLGLAWLIRDFLIAAATLCGTSILGAVQARSVRYVLYGAVFFVFVLPGWLRALATLGHDDWSTRHWSTRQRSESA